MAQDTQYCSLRYILGTAYSGKTEASEISPRNNVIRSWVYFFFSFFLPIFPRRQHQDDRDSEDFDNVRIAADSTMFLIVNLFIALSLGVHLEQLEHRMGLTCPLPFLLRPLFHACQPALATTRCWSTLMLVFSP